MSRKVNGYNHSEARDRLVEDYIRTLKLEIKRLRNISESLYKNIVDKKLEIADLKREIFEKDVQTRVLKELIND